MHISLIMNVKTLSKINKEERAKRKQESKKRIGERIDKIFFRK